MGKGRDTFALGCMGPPPVLEGRREIDIEVTGNGGESQVCLGLFYANVIGQTWPVINPFEACLS